MSFTASLVALSRTSKDSPYVCYETQGRYRSDAARVDGALGIIEEVTHHRARTLVLMRLGVTRSWNLDHTAVSQRTGDERAIRPVARAIEFTCENERRDIAGHRRGVLRTSAKGVQLVAEARVGCQTACEIEARGGRASKPSPRLCRVQWTFLETRHCDMLPSAGALCRAAPQQ